jgi:cyanophycinase
MLVEIDDPPLETGDVVALSAFVERSGQRNGRIVILPAAAPDPVEMGRRYAQRLLSMGAGLVAVLHVETRSQANDEHAVALMAQATGILILGRTHAQLASLLDGTALLQTICRRQYEGCVIAATSAGSSLLTDPTISQA